MNLIIEVWKPPHPLIVHLSARFDQCLKNYLSLYELILIICYFKPFNAEKHFWKKCLSGFQGFFLKVNFIQITKNYIPQPPNPLFCFSMFHSHLKIVSETTRAVLVIKQWVRPSIAACLYKIGILPMILCYDNKLSKNAFTVLFWIFKAILVIWSTVLNTGIWPFLCAWFKLNRINHLCIIAI